VYLYNKITQNLNQSNKFLANSASQSNKTKLEECSAIEDNQKNSDSRYIKEEDILEDEEDEKNKLAASSSNGKKYSPKQKKKSTSSVNRIKIEKKEVDTKTIKNRRKLIYMLKFVIILFYVCLFPLKTWNLGIKSLLFDVKISCKNSFYEKYQVLMLGSRYITGFYGYLTFRAYW
jgi:hypothetical protein